jgi:hypothetical protein
MQCRACILAVVACLTAGELRAGGDLKSGPQAGALLPGSFQPFNLNGKIGKERYHCLVCEYHLKPTVLIFAREKTALKNAALADLLQKLEAAVERHQEAYLHAFIVFLSPDARTSVTDPKTEDPNRLVVDSARWEELLARLRPLADKLKNVVVAVYPAAGPTDYNLARDADVTVILYRRHQVVANFAFAEGKLNQAEVEQIMQAVDTMVRTTRKGPKVK